ncbi:LPXTG cell wall anchor domain-containing protein [Romboutsia timonensis]|nr:LPXTG cell wall anchor domain-containing protein [Romboutsia timonensis]
MQNPQTGEQSNTMLWVATGAVALMGLALLNRRKK